MRERAVQVQSLTIAHDDGDGSGPASPHQVAAEPEIGPELCERGAADDSIEG